MSFGYVVELDCPPRAALGGALPAATKMIEGARLEPAAGCLPCCTPGEPPGCIGVIAAPITAHAEQWLVRRLPDRLDGVAGAILRESLAQVSGQGARALRAEGRLAAKQPAVRQYGSALMPRRPTVTSDDVLEVLLCAGDIEPPHGLAVLIDLDAIRIDGERPDALADAAPLAALIQNPGQRGERVRFAIEAEAGDDQSIAELKAYLRAVWAGFVADVKVRVFG